MSSPINLSAFISAHAAGHKNQALAKQFHLHVSTVKRLKRRLGLGNNDPRNALGRLGELLVTQTLTAQGLAVTVMPEGHAFDLLVEGHRLDVKTSATPDGGGYRFRLNERRSSNHAAYQYAKTYQKDTDFLALAVVNAGNLTHLYVLPSALWQPSLRVHPDSPFCPYAAYREALGLLRPQVAA